jgi:hypothetical protein
VDSSTEANRNPLNSRRPNAQRRSVGVAEARARARRERDGVVVRPSAETVNDELALQLREPRLWPSGVGAWRAALRAVEEPLLSLGELGVRERATSVQDVLQCFGVAENGERLLKLSEVFGADDYGRIMAVARADDPLVLVLDAIDDFGQMVSNGPQRLVAMATTVAMGGPVCQPSPVDRRLRDFS